MTTILAQRFAALAAILAISAPGLAAAQTSTTSGDPVNISVKFSDLNLNSPAGAQTLMHRIDTAATSVCGGAPDSRELGDRARFEKCHTSVVDQAMSKLGPIDVAALAHSKAQTREVAGR
jgi:UrcA family protein